MNKNKADKLRGFMPVQINSARDIERTGMTPLEVLYTQCKAQSQICIASFTG
jgi:hypothetical protein